MATSEARILANRRNGALSQGPGPEGRLISRANSLKHGLTGAGVVIAAVDAEEVARKSGVYAKELNAKSEVEIDLAHRAALHAVRMDRCADQQTAALSERVRQAEADFEAPEGADEATAAKLREEAGRRAMFDPSKEACLARKYEAAAERGFFRALKEIRQLQKDPVQARAKEAVAQAQASMARLGSFFPASAPAKTSPPASPSKPIPTPSKPVLPPSKPLPASMMDWDSPRPGVSQVPIAIGKAR